MRFENHCFLIFIPHTNTHHTPAPTEPQEMSKKAKEASGAFDTVVGDYIQRCESLRIGPDAALLAYLEAFSHGAVSTKLLLTHRWSDADLTAAASALFTVGPHLLELHWPLYHASRRSPFSVQAAAPSARAHSLIHHGAKWSRQGWFLLAHVLAKMPNLSHLTIPHQALSDDDFVSVLLPALQKLPKLKELRLYGNHLTHKSATPLAESIRLWPSLTFLDMANNWLAYSGTTILKNALESCKKERGVIGLRYRGNHVYEEAFSVATHLAGFVASVYGVYYLMLKANANGSPSYMWSAYLFGSSLMMMFASSTLFHTFFRMSLLHDLFQKMDHASIYCLIAGSYTPYLLISLANSPSSFYMMCFQWSFCVFGVFLSLLGVSPQLRSFSCLMMGWSIMFTIQEVYQALTQDAFIWLVVGGLFYSFGVIFYLRKGAFSHGIWHLFVMGGAFSHYWSIYHYIM